MFVRWGHAADKGIRMGWLLAALGLGAGFLAFVVHNHIFLSASKGLSAGLLISSAVQFLSKSKA